MIEKWDNASLKRVCLQRQRKFTIRPFKTIVSTFMRREVIPRRKKLSQLAEAWTELLPAELVEHSCLESYRGGTLRVLVDSSPHLSELDLLLREGLLDHVRECCPTVPLSRIRLVRGSWYRSDEEGNKIPNF